MAGIWGDGAKGAGTQRLARGAVVYEAGDPPRAGGMAFWADPRSGADSGGLPEGIGEPGELTVVVAPGHAARTVPVVRLPVGDAVPVLSRARQARPAHPAAVFWGAAAVVALQLVARGRLLPGVSVGDFDAWRVGPLDPDDVERIRELAAAMPAEARAVPGVGRSPLELLDARTLVRGCLDAVADGMPRTAAAVRAAGGPAYAAAALQRVPELRAWAHEVSAGMDSGVRVSLRLELGDGAHSGADTVEAAGGNASFRAVVQVHSLADPTRVADAGDLWEGAGQTFDQHGFEAQGFGARARLDTVLAVRRAARVWAPLGRLLHAAVPDELVLVDEEVEELLGHAGVPPDAAATAGPTLVVCPASLLGNWEREIGRVAPGTAVRRFHGPGRSLDGAPFEEYGDGFVLTTYGTMRLDARLGARRWGLLVADEAQHVKNPVSGTARALRTIPAGARVALTPPRSRTTSPSCGRFSTGPRPVCSAPFPPSAPAGPRRSRPATPGRSPRCRWQRSCHVWYGPSCCAAASPIPASPPSCRPRRRPTNRSR